MTPALDRHDGTYSLILQDADDATGIYQITQLSADLQLEWQYRNQSADDDHPTGFEWCVHAPASIRKARCT